MDDPCPCLVERLIPDAAAEGIDCELFRAAPDQRGAFLVDSLAMLSLDEIHLVH